jgi:hypothetical protein
MEFVAKPSDEVVRDIRTLYVRYGCDLLATDSIMARDHLKNMLPKLALFQDKPAVLYEMKPNITEEDVVAMAEGHVVAQMGIESLSTRLLKLMRKGGSTIRILALLKWCRERRVDVAWNQLCGIPGESDADYDEQIALMEKIPHFKPPYRVNPIVIDRYSPYFEAYRDFGWERISPIPFYRVAHPQLDDDALSNIAYHFEGFGGVSTDSYLDRFEAAVKQWKARHQKGDGLFWHRYIGMTQVERGHRFRIMMNETVRRVIEMTHRIVPVSRVVNETGADAGLIDKMVEDGFLYVERGNVINLTERIKVSEFYREAQSR